MRGVHEPACVPPSPNGRMRADPRKTAHLLNTASQPHLKAQRDDLREDAASFLRIEGELLEIPPVARSDPADLAFVPCFAEGQEAEPETIVRIELVVGSHSHRGHPPGKGDLHSR